MSKHTPGPWNFNPPTAANPSTASVTACGGFVSIYTAPLTLETEANARLIAAAPELLASLRAMVEADDAGWPLAAAHQTRDAARAAIAKAEGREL